LIPNKDITKSGNSLGSTSASGAWPKVFDTPFETYEVIGAPIGEGGAGRVYPVKSGSNERLALKCLSPERITTDRRKRFKNEIAFCSKYEHRNIIQVLDSGLSIINGAKCPFYVMPEFPMTLRKLLDQGISSEKVLPLFSQILDGIDAAHQLSAFHRDLKPENILYDPTKDLAVIADFGIAHFEEDAIATQVDTKITAKMANLGYSAPEQRIRGKKVDHRADIFALGLILNEMFTGIVPHGTGYKVIAFVAPDFAYLDPLVERMIQNNPEARPDSIDTIKKDLIARGNAFVALQRVNAITKEVIPKFEAGRFYPLRLASADWQDGHLILELDRAPEIGWVRRFKQPNSGSWTSIQGSGPETFQFVGHKAIVGATEESAPQIVDYAKRYLEMANQGYQMDLNTKAKQEEHAYREKLRKEQAATEARARVLSKLNI
jgi:serine/threonine protein kinase